MPVIQKSQQKKQLNRYRQLLMQQKQNPFSQELNQERLQTVTPTLMPDRKPTLTNSEMKLVVDENLLNNKGCDLPCLWGFTAGKTSVLDLQDYYYHLGWKMSEYERDLKLVYSTGKDLENDLAIRAEYIYKNSQLELISYALTLPKLNARDQIFSPSFVMNHYGVPNQVWVSINLSGEQSLDNIEYGSFEVYLYYPDFSFFVRYNGYSPHENDSFYHLSSAGR